MKHLIAALVDALDAYDIEGIDHLPDQVKPTPSTKPKQVICQKEKSEEVQYIIR